MSAANPEDLGSGPSSYMGKKSDSLKVLSVLAPQHAHTHTVLKSCLKSDSGCQGHQEHAQPASREVCGKSLFSKQQVLHTLGIPSHMTLEG